MIYMKVTTLLLIFLLTACASQPINTELSGGTGVGLGYAIPTNTSIR